MLLDVHASVMRVAESAFRSLVMEQNGTRYLCRSVWIREVSREIRRIQTETTSKFISVQAAEYIWMCFCVNHGVNSNCFAINGVQVLR